MTSLTLNGSAGRGSDPNYVLPLDDAKAQEIYDNFDTYSPLEQRTLGSTLRNWAEQKVAQEQEQKFKELETIYEDVGAWWKESGGEPMDDEIVYGAANRKFIATQLGTTAREVGDLYPHERDKWFLQNFQKKPKDDTEAFNMIRESMASRKKVEEAYDMITGDVALALFDQIDKGQPVDVPTLINKWKTENAETVASLPEDWEVNTLKAAGEYFTDTERMLREQGPTLQKLYAHLVKATGRKVEGAPENDPQTVEEVNALLDELAKLPPEVRQRGYGAILMAAKRQGMDEKGFFEMAAEAWPRSLNAIKTLGFTAQETEIEERVRLLESGKTVYRDPLTGGLAGQSSAALMGASGQAVRQGEPVPEEERQHMLAEAKTELERFQVLREVRDLADNRFDPVRSNLKGGIGKIAQDVFLLGPQSFVYTGMAAIPVAGPLLSGAAIYSDEYNQLRLEGFSSAQSKALAAVSAPIQTFFEVSSAKLIFGRYKWYKNLVQKLVNPARFTRTAQGTVSFFGKVLGENFTEGLQDMTTPVVQDFANRLNEEIPDVDWNQTFTQWYDSRLEVFAATLMPVIGGHTVEMFTDGKRFSSAERREKLFYGPLGINQKEKRYIEDGTTPEERRQRSIEVLQAMPKERVKAAQDVLAQQSQTAAVTQQDATTPTLEAQKDANGRVTYIVRDEGGKEVYRTNKQDAAEEAYILATAKSTAAQFSNDRMIVQELVSQWESADPNNVARTGQTENAQQVLDRLTAENNTAQIEILQRRIAQSPMAGTPLNQIQILGEATVEDVGNMVFRGVITLNESSRPQDAREEMHHVAVRRALGTNRVTLDQLREWLAASESVLETTLARDTQDDIVESLAIVQRAYEDGQIDAGRETQLPPSFVDYIKRMIAAFAEVLKRAVALREAFAAGALPQEYEAFLAETTGVSQQEVVDRARERTEQEVRAQQNYSIGLREPSATSFNETTLPDGNVRFIAYHGSEQPLSQLDDRPIYVSSLADGAGYGDATRMVIEGRFLPVDEIEAFAAKYGIAMEDLFHEEASMEQDLQEALRSEGYDGAIYYDQRRDDGDVMPAAVIVNPNAIQVAPVANYSIVRSVDHFKNDTRFDKLVKDGRVFTGVDVNDFIDQHILLHSPDNAFAGTIQLTDGGEIKGKGGVYYPALYADDNYFWASTEAMVMRTANHLNEIGAKNGGRILMGLVSAPVEKLFSSTSMSTGVVKFLNALTNDSRAGLSKDDLNAMLVAASKVEVVVQTKTKTTKKTFSTKLKESDRYAKNFAKIDELLAPDGSIFQVRKAFVESLAEQISKHLNATPAAAEYVAGILADAENKHAKNAIKRGKLSKASFLQGLGNMLTEPFLRDFQEHGNGKIYAIVEVQGEVKGIATTEHESYPATIVPVNKKSKVKLHVLKEAVDWQDVVGKETGQYATPQERLNLLPTSGMSSTNLKVLGVKAGSSAAPLNYSIGDSAYFNEVNSLVDEYGYFDLLEKARAAGDDSKLIKLLDEIAARAGYTIKAFHGTQASALRNNAFDDEDAPYRGGLLAFFAADRKFSEAYTSGRGKIYDVYLRINKLLDYRDEKTIKRVAKQFYKETGGLTNPFDVRKLVGERFGDPVTLEEFTGELLQGIWAAFEATQFQEWLRDNTDYDGIAMLENGSLTYGIYDPSQVKSADAITMDEGGNIIPPSQRFNQETPNIDYSISTQSEIDRVQAAMGALDRSPLDTLEITEKLRKRFASIMAENMVELAAMRQGGVAEREVLDEEGNPIGPQPTGATTKATGAEIRRTKLLQALGELDGLLSALPPQVAAKVGGYTVLANIGTGDRALSNFFIKRLEMIDKELERYLKDRYTKALDQLFQRAKPRQDAAGKVPQGKLGASVHALFDQLKLATKKTVVEVDGEVTSLEQQVASGELEAEEEAMKGLLADVLPLFANWETADASRMAQAVQIGFDILRKAYKRQRELTQIKRNQQEDRRLVARESTGITGDIDVAINEQQNIAGKRWQQWKALNVNLFGFDQLISFVFGRDSKITKEIVNAQRKADNVKADELIGVWEEWQGVLSELASIEDSRSMKATHRGQDIVYRLAEPKTAKIKHTNMQGEQIELEFSQNQLITITMMWMQPKGRAHMMGKLDSDGNPIGDWHYDQEFVNRAEAKLTPEARAIRRFLLRKYAEEWSSINEVFVRLRGINMPQEDFYSPLGVDPVVAIDSGLLADPSTGFALSAPNRTPPALRSRGAAVAKPKFQDAVQVYFAHRKQMAHWKAYAEFNSDMLSVLGHRNTRNAVEAKGGVEALKTLNKWLTYMTQGGNIDAAAGLAMNEYFNGVMGRIASFVLFGKVVTIAIQSTQLGAAAAKMPFPSYIKRLAKLLTGQMSWGQSLRSPYIQRRIKEMPPQVQLAMEGLLANKPSYVAEAARRVGWYISGSDGLYTAGTYAMIYDYRLEQAKKAGLSGPEAERVAREEAERDTDEVAQPTRMGARSAFEATMTSPLARSAWAFGSDARKNWAMNSFLWFSNASADRKRQALYFTLVISTAMATVIRTIARDIKDDDDEEWFDEKNWDVRRMALMMATDFVYGFPVLGEMAEETAFRLFGEYRPQGSVLSVGDAPAALSRMPQHIADTLNGEADTDKIVKDVNRMLQGMGLFAPQAASAAALSNAAKDLYEFTKPLWKDDE